MSVATTVAGVTPGVTVCKEPVADVVEVTVSQNHAAVQPSSDSSVDGSGNKDTASGSETGDQQDKQKTNTKKGKG